MTIRKECLGKYVSSIRAKLERIYAIKAHDRVLGNPPSFMYPSQFHKNIYIYIEKAKNPELRIFKIVTADGLYMLLDTVYAAVTCKRNCFDFAKLR